MSNPIGGREVEVGLAIEATPGTKRDPDITLKWATLGLQAVAEKAHLQSARGVRNQSSDSITRRKYGEGNLETVMNVENAPYLFALFMGTVSSEQIETTGKYTHTITIQNENASMKTATVSIKEGGIVTEQYGNTVADSLNLEASDEYARLTVDLLGDFPESGSFTPSYTKETEFAYKDMAVQFGTDISTANEADATKLKSVTLNGNNNVQLDEAFLSGSNQPHKFIAGQLEITGSYSIHFKDEAELNKYKNNTKEAMIIKFTGADLGDDIDEEIKIKLARLVLTSPPKEYNIDGVVVLNQDFTVEFEATDKEMQVEITNENDGNNYAPTT